MKRILTTAAAALLVASTLGACGGGGSDSGDANGSQTRKVLVDYRHDEAETAMFAYYPRKVTVRQGDVVEFDQAWTGEPHSVTFGRLVEPKLNPVIALLDRVTKSGIIPEGEPEEFTNFDLPFALGDTGVTQNAAQPCFVAEADSWPGDDKTPCPKREKPAFTGTEAVYSSGIIPFEGVGGNSFRVPIAADAKPGTYGYFCNVHGPLQFGQVEIVAKDTPIPSARDVAKEARQEAEAATAIMVSNVKAAKAGKPVVAGETGEEKIATKGKHLIGDALTLLLQEAAGPRDHQRVRAQAGDSQGGRKGDVDLHQRSHHQLQRAQVLPRLHHRRRRHGGLQRQGREGGGVAGTARRRLHDDGPPPDPVKIDAGTWDGKGFRSSGLDYPDGSEFSVTFTKAGTYPYACLIHPTMVGTIVVK